MKLASLLVDIAYQAFERVRNRPKAVAKRAAKAARKAAKQPQPDEGAGEFFQSDEGVSMDAVKGALKSKLVWLGFVEALLGLTHAVANGGVTEEAIGAFGAAVATVALRAVTSQSLADKGR